MVAGGLQVARKLPLAFRQLVIQNCINLYSCDFDRIFAFSAGERSGRNPQSTRKNGVPVGHFDPFSDTFPYHRDLPQNTKTPLELHVLKGCLGSRIDTILYQPLFPLNKWKSMRIEPVYEQCGHFRVPPSAGIP